MSSSIGKLMMDMLTESKHHIEVGQKYKMTHYIDIEPL